MPYGSSGGPVGNSTGGPTGNESFVNEQMFSGPRRVQQRASFENSVVQTLNAWIPHPDDPKRRYFRVEAFERSLEKWDGVPLVFADRHPDLDLLASNPEAALAQVNGTIVGAFTKPRIEREGHPVMIGAIAIDDPEVLALWEAGELSLSTGFSCMVEGQDVVEVTAPNHILLFREDRDKMPKDRGTRIANMQDGSDSVTTNQTPGTGDEPQTTARSFLASLVQSLQTLLAPPEPGTAAESANQNPAPAGGDSETITTDAPPLTEDPEQEDEDMADAEMKQKLETAETALKTRETELANMKEQVATLQQELDALKATNTELQKTVNQVNQERADARFNAVLDKIAPGEKHTEEQKQQLRKQFDEDPYAFMARLPELMVNQSETKQEGKEHEALGNAQEQESPGLFS
ncbi:MAG: hypothetical protein PHT97_13945 [Methanoculleus sp.]|uniref:hypothetical protein n=1 Tax=Methanoculleus sp. TaxID=90427 RepID=UPI0026106E48|nr:hypothetical protein [Methanoculleus sp.]MDD4472245.1 hypothetical protein [Methanoculleus sp.]